jgi:hypothetical protein
MGWIEGISEAISCIEENITEELTIGDIAGALMCPHSTSKEDSRYFAG